jgi:hypothetical protein
MPVGQIKTERTQVNATRWRQPKERRFEIAIFAASAITNRRSLKSSLNSLVETSEMAA